MTRMLLLYGSMAAVIVVLYGAADWRRAVKFALFIVVIEGVVRKWLLPQFSDLVYFGKDIVLIGAYIGYYTSKEKSEKSVKLNFPVVLLIFLIFQWGLLQAILNPRLGSPIVGLVGLRGYLLNVPLLWIVKKVFNSEHELTRFLRNHLLLTIPVGTLGIVQFFSSPFSILNIYAGSDITHVATFGYGNQLVRVSGPFPYLDSYVVYLTVIFGLLIHMFFYEKQKWWRLIYMIELCLIVINLFMTGSRSGIYMSVLFLIGYFSILGIAELRQVWRLFRQFAIPVIVVVFFIMQVDVVHSAFDAFMLRATSGGDSVQTRVIHTISAPFSAINYTGIWGYGIGATQGASKAIGSILGWSPGEHIPIAVEEEPVRIMLEIGPVGFTLWYGLRIALLLTLWSTFRKLKKPYLKQLAVTVFLLQGIQFTDQLVTHPVFSLYYWFLGGFLYLLPKFDKLALESEQISVEESGGSYASSARIFSANCN